MSHVAALVAFAVSLILVSPPAAYAKSCKYPAPENAKGIYLPAPNAENPLALGTLIELAKKREINSFVIDVNESGNFLLEQNRKILRWLRQECVWPIARLVVFKADATWMTDIFDKPLDEKALPRELLRNRSGKVWRDTGGHAWLNPLDPMVWKIAVDMAIYAVDLGFREIQFDYVRFPTDGSTGEIAFDRPVTGKIKAETITAFLSYAWRRVKTERPGTLIAADIFGEAAMVTPSNDPSGNGQSLRALLSFVDRVAPMVYPSHWAPGRFGCPIPAECPGHVVKSSLAGLAAYAKRYHPELQVCPWLQDFTARNWRTTKSVPYGAREVREQISAAEKLGLSCWFLWNPKRMNGEDPAVPYSVKALRLRFPALVSD